MQHVARGCNPTKQGVSTTHSKKRPNQNDGGADNRKKSIVKPSKKKSIVSKSRRKFTVDEKVAMVKEIEADIAREEDNKYAQSMVYISPNTMRGRRPVAFVSTR